MRRPWCVVIAGLATLVTLVQAHADPCGGTERWLAKTGIDPDRHLVESAKPIPMRVSGLNALPQLREAVPHGNNSLRLPEERKVYTVSGFLELFKSEKDTDYHLVIPDA